MTLIQDMAPAADPAPEQSAAAVRDGTSSRLGRRLRAGGLLGIVGLVALILISIGAQIFIDKPATDVNAIAEAPSWHHILGTDFAGRDNLQLVLRGGWDMLKLAFVAGFLMSAIATLVGLLSAFSGGLVDKVLLTLTDLWLTVPRFVLLLVIASLFPVSSTITLAALIAVFEWPSLARQIRAQALSLRGREYVEAARLLQLRRSHILLRYLVPAIGPFITISTIQAMTTAIYQQVGLAFFGLVPLKDNWGVLFSVAYSQNALYLPAAAWSLFAPVGAICLLQFCLVLASRSLEQVFDPRLRGA